MNAADRPRAREKRDYWERRSGLQTGRSTPAPIRPADTDIALYASWARMRGASVRGGELRTLMLGVTRSIAAMPWPAGTALLAVDWSPGMVRQFWPAGYAPRGSSVVLGDWREMPIASESCDLAVGDTCYSALAGREDCVALNAEIARVLKPGAWWVQRCFLRPERAENVDLLLGELEQGRIGVFEVFCWRLAMTLHGADGIGVRCADVWQAWNRHVRDPQGLFARLGWPAQGLAAIDRWRGEPTRIYFPTLLEVRELAVPDFEFVEARFPDYEMGDRCPMLVLHRH